VYVRLRKEGCDFNDRIFSVNIQSDLAEASDVIELLFQLPDLQGLAANVENVVLVNTEGVAVEDVDAGRNTRYMCCDKGMFRRPSA
jgi:hypothetical protein